MLDEDIREMGPIDYIILEWPSEPSGEEVVPLLLDLVDRGIVKILDITFVSKGQDGAVRAIEVGDMGPDAAGFAAFDGAATGLVDEDDLAEAAAALEPGTSAAILVWENLWAVPVATALRRSGGQLVASGRIPVQAIVAALDALETTVAN